MQKRVGIYGNAEKPGVKLALEQVVSLLKGNNCRVIESLATLLPSTNSVITSSDILDLASNSDVILSLGGDGTLLTAARAISRVNPDASLIGINLGRLGFIAEHPTEIIPEIVNGLKDNSLTTEHRLMLEAIATSESNPTTGVHIRRDILEPSREKERGDSARVVSLNEVVIDNFGSTRMLTFEVRIQGSLLGTLRADGLLVSTPTGSTGYSASAGGPLVEPTSSVLIVSPIAPHSLSVRPVVVPEWYEIDLRIFNDAGTPILIVADGQEEIVVETPAIVKVSQHHNKLNLLRHPSGSYFDLLRTKLLWSADVRAMQH